MEASWRRIWLKRSCSLVVSDEAGKGSLLSQLVMPKERAIYCPCMREVFSIHMTRDQFPDALPEILRT